MNRHSLLMIGALIIALTSCARATPSTSISAPTMTPTTKTDAAAYYPTQAWRTSTPEQQGIDSTVLAKLFDEIQAKQLNIHSIVILKSSPPIGSSSHRANTEYAFTFDKDTIDLRVTGFIEGNTEQVRGKVQN